MKELKIDKNKAIEMERIKSIVWAFIGAILWYLPIMGLWYLFISIKDNAQVPHFFILIGTLSFMIVYEIINFWACKRKINSLEQMYEKDELMTRYEIITKTKNSARLQVVNNVDITQSIWDKFYGFFNVNVDYGFGDSAYSHEFNYLTEEQAEKVQDEIKPRSRLGINLR
jgi:membrane protein YdbS with pleckstrin-like domain